MEAGGVKVILLQETYDLTAVPIGALFWPFNQYWMPIIDGGFTNNLERYPNESEVSNMLGNLLSSVLAFTSIYLLPR